jgi:phenylalanine-4-hydroxylase
VVYRESKTNRLSLGTIELSTLQVSGVFTNVIEQDGKPIYIQTTGKQLASREKELVGHGTANHAEGFGSPIGN